MKSPNSGSGSIQSVKLSQPQSLDAKLKPYIKIEKTTKIQYEILKIMIAHANDQQGIMKSDTFAILFNQFTSQIRQLSLYEFLSYKLWLNDSFPAAVRQKTRFFNIVFDWIVRFQMRVGKLQTYKEQFDLVSDFIKQNTKTVFERVILIEQIYSDLQQLIPGTFWEQKCVNDIIQPHQDQFEVQNQDAIAIINLLQEVVFYNIVGLSIEGVEQEALFHDRTFDSLGLKYYTTFVLNCIKMLLTNNFDASIQTDLTRIALRFLHRNVPASETLKIVKSLMVKTSKAVRYALVVEYIKFYEFLEKSHNDQVIEELQNCVYFRQLIIGKKEIEQAAMIKHQICCVDKKFYVKARVKERVYISNQQDQECIVRMQIYIAGDQDIALKIFWISDKETKETNYFQEARTTDKRLELILKWKGLYAIQFDNTYSWINGKNITLKFDQLYRIKTQLEKTETDNRNENQQKLKQQKMVNN